MKELSVKPTPIGISLTIQLPGEVHKFNLSTAPSDLVVAPRRTSDIQRLAWALARSGIFLHPNGSQPTHLEIYHALGSAFGIDLASTDQTIAKTFDRGTDMRTQIRFLQQLADLLRDEVSLHEAHASRYRSK